MQAWRRSAAKLVQHSNVSPLDNRGAWFSDWSPGNFYTISVIGMDCEPLPFFTNKACTSMQDAFHVGNPELIYIISTIAEPPLFSVLTLQKNS